MKTLLIASLTSLLFAGSAFANDTSLEAAPEVAEQAIEALESEATEAIEIEDTAVEGELTDALEAAPEELKSEY